MKTTRVGLTRNGKTATGLIVRTATGYKIQVSGQGVFISRAGFTFHAEAIRKAEHLLEELTEE